MKKVISIILFLVIALNVAGLSVLAQTAEISDSLLSAIRVKHSDQEIVKEDISVRFMKELSHDKYILKYTVSNYAYSCDVVDIYVGDYHISSSRPLPVIFMDGTLYEIEDAYDNGLLSESDLRTMSEFEELSMVKTVITEELMSAMGYYAKDDYINIRFEVQGFDKTIADIDGWIDDIRGAVAKLNEHYESLHQKLLKDVLADIEYKDQVHNNGVSVVAVKKSDIEKLSHNEFVLQMDYISEVHLKYIEQFDARFKEYTYEEKCRETDEDGEFSYWLINAHNNMGSSAIVGFRFGDHIVRSGAIYSNFTYGYGIYDIKEEKFYDVYDLRDCVDKYYRLEDHLAFFSRAVQVGDSDGDLNVTTLDATKIQRFIAQLDYLWYDAYTSHENNKTVYVSDVDSDGEISVLDATAIQFKLAKYDSY